MSDPSDEYPWHPYVIVPETPRTRCCKPGAYPWDQWRTRAEAAGVASDLAGLGRAVMRAAELFWMREHLSAECGWSDAGAAMLDRAVRDPDGTRARWQWLLDSSGGTRPVTEAEKAAGWAVWRCCGFVHAIPVALAGRVGSAYEGLRCSSCHAPLTDADAVERIPDPFLGPFGN